MNCRGEQKLCAARESTEVMSWISCRDRLSLLFSSLHSFFRFPVWFAAFFFFFQVRSRNFLRKVSQHEKKEKNKKQENQRTAQREEAAKNTNRNKKNMYGGQPGDETHQL
jgi:hypothetical protein